MEAVAVMPAGRAALALLVALATLGVPCAGGAQVTGHAVDATAVALPAGAEARVLALIADVGFERPQPEGLVVDGAAIDRDRVRFELRRVSAGGAGPPLATLELLPRALAAHGEPTSASFALRAPPHADAAAEALLGRLRQSVRRYDRGDLYRPVVVVDPARGRAMAPVVRAAHAQVAGAELPVEALHRRDLFVAGGAALALLVALLLELVRRRRSPGQTPSAAALAASPPADAAAGAGDVAGAASAAAADAAPAWRPALRWKVTHLLPATLQVALFAYLSLYWRSFTDVVVPLIALELVFAVLLDALIDLRRRGVFQLSAGVLPIVLSTNLFVVFEAGAVHLSLLAIAVGLLTRQFVTVGGRHVFNPSALGAGVAGALSLLLPGIGYGDTAYQLALPPNMAEAVLIVGTVVQLRLPIVLVSLGALVGLHTAGLVFSRLALEPTWAPVTLVLTLLVTDPATMPRTPLARLGFGLLAGLAMRAMSEIMQLGLAQDHFAKVIGVALANLAVGMWAWQQLHRQAPPSPLPPVFARLRAALERPLAPRWNLAHVGLWWALMGGALAFTDVKATHLQVSRGQQRAHVEQGTPFAAPTAAGRLRCEDNPMFCQGFSFPLEVSCWLAGAPRPGDGCGSGPAGHRLPLRGDGVAERPKPGLGAAGGWVD